MSSKWDGLENTISPRRARIVRDLIEACSDVERALEDIRSEIVMMSEDDNPVMVLGAINYIAREALSAMFDALHTGPEWGYEHEPADIRDSGTENGEIGADVQEGSEIRNDRTKGGNQ